MHREILRCLPGVMIDHINGNSLDNRKCNLRAATNSQNMANQPKQKRNLCRFKGICVDKKNGGWRAQISINGETKNLGHFLDDESAARAYNDAARKQFGEYARLNEFPDVARINKGTSSQKAKASTRSFIYIRHFWASPGLTPPKVNAARIAQFKAYTADIVSRP